MKHSDIIDKLVLICDSGQDGKPLGTGFIVNEFGHFITSYHVIKRVLNSPKDCIRCRWKGGVYRIQYIESLHVAGFYDAHKNVGFTSDLTIFQLRIHNKSLRVDHLPSLTFDMNKKLSAPAEVSFSGFNCEVPDSDEYPDFLTVELTKYEEKSGLWRFKGKDTVWQGYSGSPVLHPELGEVVGVVLRRFEENHQCGYIRSLHMLCNELELYGHNCEHFFRSPFSLYGRYHKARCCYFQNESWPYAIDKKEFVDIFDFKINCFPSKNEPGKVKSGECIIPFAVEQLKEHPVFCVGYYGMGKTTISKFLFTEYLSYSTNEYPIFISFRDAELPQISSDHWNDYVAQVICQDQDFKRCIKEETGSITKDELILQYFKHFVNHNQIILIFDGLDEVPCDRTTLGKFAKWLKSLSCTYFLTSRMEFYAFFDVFGKHMENQSNLIVELMPWREKQWKRYTENLIKKYPENLDGVKALRKALDNHVYKTLPERPLFLKMISDQELDNKTELEEIPVDLKANRAAIYNRYIRWKIIDDWQRKRGIEYAEKINFQRGSFRLFRELANIEYEKSIPKSGAVELLGRDLHDGGSYTRAYFSEEEIHKACDGIGELKPDFVEKHFSASTFFSMIRRDIREKKDGELNKEFRFSHKSFCEYLVGYNPANKIFKKRINEAKCGYAWDFYQTHEVSAHFQDEIDRIVELRCIDEKNKKMYLQKAFEKVLFEKRNLQNYSERFEEVLYYTGRLEIESPEILHLLKKISTRTKEVNPIYYRTAHLSLSMCEDVVWCEKYIRYLIKNFYGEKQAFQLNSEIQINYYGKGNIRTVLCEDIDKFIMNKTNLLGILPLKIFSYFVCLPFDAEDIKRAREYLSLIKQKCEMRGHTRMVKIMNETLPMLESVSGSN